MAIEFGPSGFRFASEASESAFRDTYRDGARRGRKTLVLVVVAYTVATPLLGPLFAGTQISDYQPLLWTMLMLAAPACLLGVASSWGERLYAHSSLVMLVMALAALVYHVHLLLVMAAAKQSPPIGGVAMMTLAYCILARGRAVAVAAMVALTAVTGAACAMVPGVDAGPRDLLLFYTVCALALAAGLSVELTARRAWEARQQLQWSATFDELTGIYNRRAFEDESERVLRQAARQQCGMSVLAIDLDHFKAINDTHGHLVGDEVIRCVGEELRLACRRPLDLPARLGGEEFLLVYFDVSAAHTQLLASEIHRRIRCLEIPAGDGTVRVTASIGAITGVPTANTSMRDFIARADRLLYGAKHAGRDRVVMGRLLDEPDALPALRATPATPDTKETR